MKVGFFAGRFNPLHAGHLYIMNYGISKCDKFYIILCSAPRDKIECEKAGFKYADGETRFSWLGNLFSDFTTKTGFMNVILAHIRDDSISADSYDWNKGIKDFRSIIKEPIDYIFSSEPSYTTFFDKGYPEATHIVVDEYRKNISVSATNIRENLSDCWEFLPSVVKGFYVNRILITGTESSGKSVLTKKLSQTFNTNYVHEIGRDYCEKYSNNFTEELFDEIAMKHWLAQEEAVQTSNKMLFVDSDAVVTQYYLKMYLEKKSPLIDAIIKKEKYDRIIFCEPDVEWINDGLRFKGEEGERNRLNIELKDMYRAYGMPFETIKGDYLERFLEARRMVQ